MMTPEVTIHIVDDDEAFRDSLCVLLRSLGFIAIGYGDAKSFGAIAADAGGCALVDVNMPDMDGIALQESLVRMGAKIPVVIMTGGADIPMAVKAMRAGAIDFIEKPLELAKLTAAIERARGQSAMASRDDPAVAAFKAKLPKLTLREREILSAVIAGHPTKVIAYHMDISPRTVHAHRLSIGEKLGVTGLPNLVRLALAAEVKPELLKSK